MATITNKRTWDYKDNKRVKKKKEKKKHAINLHTSLTSSAELEQAENAQIRLKIW